MQDAELEVMDRCMRNLDRLIGELGLAMGQYDARMTALLKQAGARPEALSELQETQMSFNLQYLQLQSQMQDESRRFTLLSNIMKTKHDTAKNSISNVR